MVETRWPGPRNMVAVGCPSDDGAYSLAAYDVAMLGLRVEGRRSVSSMARSKAIESEAYTYTVVFEPDEEAGGFTVTCPALRGLVTEGDTLEEARAMAADAIKGYLESLRKHGQPIPLSEEYHVEPIRESVTVRL